MHLFRDWRTDAAKIEAELATLGSAATKVLQASPLAGSVGKTRCRAVQGAVTGNLDISIRCMKEAQKIFVVKSFLITHPCILLSRTAASMA